MGHSPPPAGLSRVVTLKPKPVWPFVSSISSFLPIFRVLIVIRALALVPGIVGGFLVARQKKEFQVECEFKCLLTLFSCLYYIQTWSKLNPNFVFSCRIDRRRNFFGDTKPTWSNSSQIALEFSTDGQLSTRIENTSNRILLSDHKRRFRSEGKTNKQFNW